MKANELKTIAALLALGLLAACSGGKTYGTGVSQESQLLSDLGGLVALGGNKPEKKIDYNARPTLVRSPGGSSLPAPVEGASADDPNFPVDPETARAARLGVKADSTAREGGSPRDPEVGDGKARTDTSGYFRRRSATVGSVSEGRDLTPGQERRAAQADREALLARRKAQGTGIGAGPRRYLTQPPSEYRTPAETAAANEPGEREKREKKRLERLLDQTKE